MKKKNYIQPEVNAMNLVGEEQVMAASGPSTNLPDLDYGGDAYNDEMQADVNDNRFGSLW